MATPGTVVKPWPNASTAMASTPQFTPNVAPEPVLPLIEPCEIGVAGSTVYEPRAVGFTVTPDTPQASVNGAPPVPTTAPVGRGRAVYEPPSITWALVTRPATTVNLSFAWIPVPPSRVTIWSWVYAPLVPA